MPIVRVSSSARIRAPARLVYSLIADYRDGHPRILPPRYYPGPLEVERGGVGAGTIIRFRMRVPGATRTMRSEVSEPEPGRTLEETDLAGGARTTFNVTEEDGGSACRVEIVTQWEARGLRGWIERLTGPPLLRRIYAAELKLLAEVAETEAAGVARGAPGPATTRIR